MANLAKIIKTSSTLFCIKDLRKVSLFCIILFSIHYTEIIIEDCQIFTNVCASSKHRHVEVSASVKRTICQYKEDHPKATIREVRQYIMNDSSIELGKSTLATSLRINTSG